MAQAKLLFPAGFEIKCRSGHIIATLRSDAYWGDRVTDVTIEWELGNEHEVGDKIRKCAACGDDWFKSFLVDIEERRP